MNLDDISYPWTQAKQAQKRLNTKSNQPYMYAHHPKNWELVYIPTDDKRKKEKPILVPVFSVLRIEAGINNVKLNGGQLETSYAVSSAKENGFTVLDPNEHDYIRVYPAMGGNLYADKFTTYEQFGTSLLSTFNHGLYNDFRIALVRDGYIKPPHSHFLRVLQNDNRKKIEKYSQSQHNPRHASLYGDALQYEKALLAAMSAIQEQGTKYYE